MSEVESVELVVRENQAPLVFQREVALHFVDRLGVHLAAAAELSSIFVVSALAVLWIQDRCPYPFNLFLGSLTVGGAVLGLIQFRNRFERKKATLSIVGQKLEYLAPGKQAETLPLSEISSITIQNDRHREWLSIKLRDGRVRSWHCYEFSENRASAERKLMRAIGPKLSAEVTLQRSSRPVKELEAFDYDNFYHAPELRLRPGVTYRYRFAPAITKEFSFNYLTLLELGVIFLLPSSFGPWVRALLIPLIYLAVVAFYLRNYLGGRVFVKSLHDRITRVDEGLRVERDGESWIVPLETSKSLLPNTLSLRGGLVRRLGGRDNPYYLDTRFLEPISPDALYDPTQDKV